MEFLQALPAELAITLANRDAWSQIGLALMFGAGCWLFGTAIARTVGLLQPGAPAGEILAVGLSSGLMVFAAWWAAIWSAGRSSFTPVAIGFALAVGLGLARRFRRHQHRPAGALAAELAIPDGAPAMRTMGPRSPILLTALAAAGFIVATALLYGATLSLSVRDDVQPLEKVDVAFYAVLGRDLATTGTETNTLPSGFTSLPGDPPQNWYHWGELWLASAAITVFGSTPLAARYFIVLPLLILAAAALTGTMVRRLAGRRSRLPFLFGFVACLILAPMPLVPSSFFGQAAVGMLASIAVYGLAAVAALLALFAVAALDAIRPSWALACFAGSAIALILPAHIVIAVLAIVGVSSVWSVRIARSLLQTRRLPRVAEIWQRTIIAGAIAFTSTLVWGQLTGHGVGTGASLEIASFNDSWRESVGVVILQAGMLLAPVVAWPFLSRTSPRVAELCLGTTAIIIGGAVAWGWNLPHLNAFYFFFGGIAVIATPVAAATVWLLLERLSSSRMRLAIVAIALCVVQLELDGVLVLGRLHGGASASEPIPVTVLEAIRRLPPEAKLAYACQPLEEISFVNSKLVGIDAQTGHRIAAMCFQADAVGPLLGAERSTQRPDAGFLSAPQRELFPDSAARPSSPAVVVFLKAHGIDYIYADALHPNSLVPEAIPVASVAGFTLLRLP